MGSMVYLKNVATLGIDTSKCTGCGMCLEVCPHNVFKMNGKAAMIVDRDACMECGACARNCPLAVIKVDAGVGCASGLINEWLMERNVRGLGKACCS